MMPEKRIAVSILTGFLGSGKTTLLNHLLQHPALQNAAVLINEFGEVGIDHLLMKQVDEDVVQLASGCLCCATRGDLVGAIRELYAKRTRAAVRLFDRMFIETSGLADPAPILQTFIGDPLLSARFRLDGIITTVDAIHAEADFSRHPQAVKQVALADRLLLTKTDLARVETIAALRDRMLRINPVAPVLTADYGVIDPQQLLNAGLYNEAEKTPDARRWLGAQYYEQSGGQLYRGVQGQHDDTIHAHCFTIRQPLDWLHFSDTLKELIEAHGESLLRIKGVLHVSGQPLPVVINGIQHLFHPPVSLPAWPDEERVSKLVFITRGVSRATVARTLALEIG